MSPRLRPLRLPALVEQRRKFEEYYSEAESDVSHDFDIVDSSSDAVSSPITPTFSYRGHLRYSSSTSSFEFTTPATAEPPSSPPQVSTKSIKAILADVEEEPLDQYDSGDDLDPIDSEIYGDLYDCLCDVACSHRDHGRARSNSELYSHVEADGFDFGFLSDGDLSTTLRSSRKPRGGTDSPLAGFTQRFNSKFAGITQWRKRQASITQLTVSDYGLEQRPTLSRAASSRSSSVSTSGRYYPDRTNEPPLPPTPALSFYGSSDSIALPSPVDTEKVTYIDPADIERDRALATTPLLPPFMNHMSTAPSTTQVSPLVSPTVAMSPTLEPQSPLIMSPPLSARPSVSSFHRVVMSGELPGMSEEDETWCNLLGHANFTITPSPYKPERFNLDTLHQLRAAWAAARVNYTKHLARTGEHYGITSKTYNLTEAKWAETTAVWRRNHDEVSDYIIWSGAADTLPKFNEDVMTAVPHMDTEGKFPERGDEDIVGPMIREVTMLVHGDATDKKIPHFWRNLAGRVGLRK